MSEEIHEVTISEHGQVIEITAENRKIRGTVQTIKVDADYPENTLTGAEFTVYRDEDCTEEVGKLHELEDGVYQLEDLEYGEYYLKETKAPKDFLLDEGVYRFEIRNDGEVVTVENEAGTGFIDQPKKGTFTITKIDAETKEPLEGAVFQVWDADGRDAGTIVTGTDGTGSLELRIGKYTYQEIEAPGVTSGTKRSTPSKSGNTATRSPTPGRTAQRLGQWRSKCPTMGSLTGAITSTPVIRPVLSRF